jgi:hypothetical protein
MDNYNLIKSLVNSIDVCTEKFIQSKDLENGEEKSRERLTAIQDTREIFVDVLNYQVSHKSIAHLSFYPCLNYIKYCVLTGELINNDLFFKLDLSRSEHLLYKLAASVYYESRKDQLLRLAICPDFAKRLECLGVDQMLKYLHHTYYGMKDLYIRYQWLNVDADKIYYMHKDCFNHLKHLFSFHSLQKTYGMDEKISLVYEETIVDECVYYNFKENLKFKDMPLDVDIFNSFYDKSNEANYKIANDYNLNINKS